jgi:hypothetical protein
MGRWTAFKDHDMNSHAPLVAAYRRMLGEFEPVAKRLGARTMLNVDELIVLLRAMRSGS